MSDFYSEETQIHVTNTYRRRTKSDTVKRAFNFVIKGMMMSSVLVSSFLQLGAGVTAKASASPMDDLGDDKNFNPNEGTQTEQVQVVKDVYQDESAMIQNLKNANKMLEATVKANQLDTWVFEKVMQSLVAIEAKITYDGTFNNSEELLNVVLKTESLVTADYRNVLSVEAYSMQVATERSVDNLKSLLGVDETATVNLTTQNEEVTEKPKAREVGARTASLGGEIDFYSTEDIKSSPEVPPSTAPKAQAQKQVTAQSKQPQQATQKIAASKYNDYNPNAYWAKDMSWVVSKGYLTGYQNQKHPVYNSKGVGNWLNPSGKLTEYQMLNVLLRYKDGSFEQARKAQPPETKNNFAFVEYQYAQKHGIKVKGSINNPNPAKKTVTRGDLAVAMVSMHYGKAVTTQQAVDFMYANGLSTGKVATEGKTLANFGQADQLTRAHIVSFLARYDNALSSGNVKDTLNQGGGNPDIGGIKPPTEKPVQPPKQDVENPTPPPSNTSKYDYSSMKGNFSKSKAFVKDGIKVSYKNNTYNTRNQSEYDQVMNHVAKNVSAKSYGEMRGKGMEREKEKLHILEDLMNGKITPITQRSHPNYRDVDNQQALGYLDAYEDVIGSGVSFDSLAKFSSARYMNTELTAGDSPTFGPPESAYDFFVKGLADCTSISYARQAVYDALGVNSAVVHSPGANHDYVIVELDGKWFVESGMTLLTKDDVLKGDFIKFAPAKHADALNFINIR